MRKKAGKGAVICEWTSFAENVLREERVSVSYYMPPLQSTSSFHILCSCFNHFTHTCGDELEKCFFCFD